jgi:hypothetical protein
MQEDRISLDDISWMPKEYPKIAYKMTYQDDYEKFVDYWSKLLNVSNDLIKECITIEKES